MPRAGVYGVRNPPPHSRHRCAGGASAVKASGADKVSFCSRNTGAASLPILSNFRPTNSVYIIMPNILPPCTSSGRRHGLLIQRLQLGAAGVMSVCHLPFKDLNHFGCLCNSMNSHSSSSYWRANRAENSCAMGSALHFCQGGHGGDDAPWRL